MYELSKLVFPICHHLFYPKSADESVSQFFLYCKQEIQRVSPILIKMYENSLLIFCSNKFECCPDLSYLWKEIP